MCRLSVYRRLSVTHVLWLNRQPYPKTYYTINLPSVTAFRVQNFSDPVQVEHFSRAAASIYCSRLWHDCRPSVDLLSYVISLLRKYCD